MPSRMTTISNCSFTSERCDRSKNGLLVLISWQMVRGDTKKSWSAPVPKPTSSSHWSRGRNSPSGVCRDWEYKWSGHITFPFLLASHKCSATFSKNTVCQYYEFSRIKGTVWHYGKYAYLTYFFFSSQLGYLSIKTENRGKELALALSRGLKKNLIHAVFPCF